MPLNIPGILVPLQLLITPRLVIPSLAVKDIRQIDFHALKTAGYRGAVVDKDNCLTIPHKDALVPELTQAWEECKRTFGEGNVLIVSNSAGTPHFDAGGIQAESITHNLQTPVLFHKSLKPSYSCIQSIRNYFSSLPAPIEDKELVIIGDRIFTDVVMANRMKTMSIWTTGVWKKESMLMRWMEKKLINGVTRWSSGGGVKDHSPFVKVEELSHHEEQPIKSNASVFEGFLRRSS